MYNAQSLELHLLSESNINFIIKNILSRFKIKNSKKTIDKCKKIISEKFNEYLDRLDGRPENNDELINTIEYLNNKCYDDFVSYLYIKYPNLKTIPQQQHIQHIPQQSQQSQVKTFHPVIEKTNSPVNDIDISDDYVSDSRNDRVSDSRNDRASDSRNDRASDSRNDRASDSRNDRVSDYDDNSLQNRGNDFFERKNLFQNRYDNSNNNYISIISEHDKNILINTYKKKQKTSPPITKNNDFLSYLTNPAVLNMFTMLIKDTNEKKVKTVKYDKILSPTEVSELLKTKTDNNSTTKLNIEPAIKIDAKIDVSPIAKVDAIQDSKVNSSSIEIIDNSDHNAEMKIDLKKITRESLPDVQKRINEILELKDKFRKENNSEMISKLDSEKNEIINAVSEFKKELKKQEEVNKNKISSFSLSREEGENNTEILDLKFDPTNDYNDLKNISITCKTNTKIKEILLLDYYVPHNTNNITRFNNKFIIYFNGKINKIIIPPGKYEIDVLLNFIKNYANYLDFTIDDDKKITISNVMGIKFDLVNDKDTIYQLLGFTEKNEHYKDKLSFTANKSYNTNANDKIFFSMSGSAMNPMLLTFNKEISTNTVIKSSKAGVMINKLNLFLTDDNEQNYDFIEPFKMCFRITYV